MAPSQGVGSAWILHGGCVSSDATLDSYGLILAASGIVSGARLDFVALLALDFQLAVASVEFGVGRRVADVVLAAQFGGDLIEGFSELVELVADVDHAAAGLFGE